MWKWSSSTSNVNFTAHAKKRLPSIRSPNSQFSLLPFPRGLIWLPFVRRLSVPTAPSNYSSPSWKTRLAVNFADSRSGSSTSTTNSITSPQNECTLASQSAVSRPKFWRQHLSENFGMSDGGLDLVASRITGRLPVFLVHSPVISHYTSERSYRLTAADARYLPLATSRNRALP